MSSHSKPVVQGGEREGRPFTTAARAFWADRRGNYAMIAAITAFPLIVGASVAIEYSDASRLRSELQQVLDASVLAGARQKDDQVEAAQLFFDSYYLETRRAGRAISASFELGEGVLDGTATRPMEMSIGFSFITNDTTIGVRSQARFTDPQNAPCISVLANSHDALRVNSGAKLYAPGCRIDVHSQTNTAAFVGAGSRLEVSELCVRGMSTNVHGYVSNEHRNCDVTPDPYAGKIAEPAVPANCTTTGPKDGKSYTLKQGMHCSVNFNQPATITFEPGVHIIRGDMNIGSGSTVIANGVTFYFPDVNGRIQANGNLTMTASAPTGGSYSGILMFEKTSDTKNNAHKTPFIFNGSKDEQLEGVIYLPNRDVTYNSTTNVRGSRLGLVANTLTINSANWKLEGYGGGNGEERSVYLSR